jgi:Na+-driven multidrug efflux pump
VSTTLLPLIVIQVAGSSANAHFYLPWVIASLIPLITVNMSTSLTVEGSRDQDQLMVYGRQALLHTIGLLVPVVAIVLLVAPYMLSLFGSSYASEGTPLLRLLALASIPNMVQVLYTSVARVQHKIVGVVLTQAATCIIGVSLSYIFLRMYGITGIGLGRLVSQTIIAAVLLLTQLRGIVSPLRSA